MSAAQLATFTLDGGWYGVPAKSVREVVRAMAHTAVPLAPGAVSGLVNLRGDVVMTVDLRTRLGFSAADTDAPLVVVNHGGESVGLLVDTIGDVISVSIERFEAAPHTLTSEARELVRGTYKLPDRLLQELDIAAVLAL